jgi:hypothetical protein
MKENRFGYFGGRRVAVVLQQCHQHRGQLDVGHAHAAQLSGISSSLRLP